MIKITDLSWLAGIIDGEGAITLYRHKKYYGKSFKRYGGIGVNVTVTNTNELLIEKVRSLFSEICGCDFPLVVSNRRTKKGLVAYAVCAGSKKRAKLILEAVIPFLIAKKQQALFVLEVCNRKPYSRTTDREIELIVMTQKLNSRHNEPVETIRRRVLTRGTQDIVRTAGRPVEEAEMSSRLYKQVIK